MDLARFGRVLWRFKYIVVAGCIVGVFLSVLTIAKITVSHGRPHLVTRTRSLYASSATVMVTQSGFPWGSALQQYSAPGPHNAPSAVGDLGRMTALAGLYVQLANSDVIRALAERKAPPGGVFSATQNYAFAPSFTSSALPIITMRGINVSPAAAVVTTQAAVDALSNYLRQQQSAAGLADAQRVVIQELQRPRAAAVVNPTKKTLPVVVFLTIMLAVIGLVFVLENLRPRVPKALALRPEVEPLIDGARRSA
jgi:hypothetical protein